MRPIKFRIWNKTPNNDSEEKPIMHYDVESWADLSSILKGEYPSLIPMQFTGLHDKNGKEIWEGDIVKNLSVYSESGYEEVVTDVFFDNGCFLERYWNGGLWKYKNIEVIGNIYENEGLLK